MESLQIRTGQISLQILDDAGNERGIFKFNPDDIQSAKRVFELQGEIEQKTAEFSERMNSCNEPDEQINLVAESVDYFKGLVDQCFGAGSSDLLFGDACTLSMFNDFFDGITPYYQKASKQRMAKYKKANK